MTQITDDIKVVLHDRRHAVHVEEGVGTFGRREAEGAKRLYVEVKDEKGNVVFESWQGGPLEDWNRVTLYFDRYGLDARGNRIGLSLWD